MDKEVEVTPAMIEAGLDALTDDYPQTVVGDSLDRALVERIYRIMSAARVREDA